MKKTTSIFFLVLFLLYGITVLAVAQENPFEPTALDKYVAKPDASYSYVLYHTEQGPGYTSYFIHMTSQQWRTFDEVDRVRWEHELVITVPWILHSNNENTAVMLVSGGKNDNELTMDTDPVMALITEALGSVTVLLNQVPNQPLTFTDESKPRTEDEILAYSLDKYFDTGDPEWAVHLPMTKAVIRAMDTVQEFLVKESEEVNLIDIPHIKDFIILGGSKRGWATWLAAAVEGRFGQDSRVKAIIPASIDLLNLDQQFVHHWEAYGFYAPAVQEYVDFDLPCRMKTTAGKALLEIIDPYEYRERLTLPKLLLNSAGDQFFLPDSSRFYYADLRNPKFLRYSLNTDHSQEQDFENIIRSAISWLDDVIDGKQGSQFSWSMEADGSIRIETVTPPKEVRLWQATNPSARDFRLESIGPAWTSMPLQDSGGGVYIARVDPPSQGWTAFTVQLTYNEPALLEADQVYTTGVRIIPDTLPYKDTGCPGFPAIGPDTLGLYQPVERTVALRNSNTAGDPDIVVTISEAGQNWLPLAGDWDGDGRDGGALYEPETQTFYLKNQISLGDPDIVVSYPWSAGGIPLAGDWDGDGRDSLGVYFPAERTFALKNGTAPGDPDIVVTINEAGQNWLPLVGDWDGDGRDGLGLYEPETQTFYVKNQISPGDPDAVVSYPQASSTWTPLAGDWDGDGRDSLGFYQPDASIFYLKNSVIPGDPDVIVPYGPPASNWVPLMGLWD